jgi:hypothetical protein
VREILLRREQSYQKRWVLLSTTSGATLELTAIALQCLVHQKAGYIKASTGTVSCNVAFAELRQLMWHVRAVGVIHSEIRERTCGDSWNLPYIQGPELVPVPVPALATHYGGRAVGG